MEGTPALQQADVLATEDCGCLGDVEPPDSDISPLVQWHTFQNFLPLTLPIDS